MNSPALASARNAAIALAGRLAELGETRLVLHQPGHPPRPLSPRQTNLPAAILAAMPSGATLSAQTLGIQILIDRTGPHPADSHAASVLALAP